MPFSRYEEALHLERVSITGRKYIVDLEDLKNQHNEGGLMLHAFYFVYGQNQQSSIYPGVDNKPVKLSDRSLYWVVRNRDINGGYSKEELCRLFPEDFGPDGLSLDNRESDGPGEEASIQIGEKIFRFPGLSSEAEKHKMNLKQALVLDHMINQQITLDDHLNFPVDNIFGNSAYKKENEELREEKRKMKRQIADLHSSYQKKIAKISTDESDRLRIWAQKLRDRGTQLADRERLTQEREDELCLSLSSQKAVEELPTAPADHTECDEKLEEVKQKNTEITQSLAITERSLIKLRKAFEMIELGLPIIKSALAEVDEDMSNNMDPKVYKEFEMVQRRVSTRVQRLFDPTMRKIPGGAKIERKVSDEAKDIGPFEGSFGRAITITPNRQVSEDEKQSIYNTQSSSPKQQSSIGALDQGILTSQSAISTSQFIILDKAQPLTPSTTPPSSLEPTYLGFHISRHLINNAKEWADEVREARDSRTKSPVSPNPHSHRLDCAAKQDWHCPAVVGRI